MEPEPESTSPEWTSPAWTSPPRDVPTPRPIPGSGDRRRRRTPPSGAELAQCTDEEAAPDDLVDATDPDEPPWVRERREEAEFARQFGDWRGGLSGRPGGVPRRSRGTAMVPVLLLLVAVAVVLVAAL